MPILAVHTPVGGVLSVLAPLGLGAAAGTALVLDLDPDGIPLPSPASVAELVRASPTLDQLRPRRRGMAVLASGGAGWKDARELVEAFGTGWPAVIVRSAETLPIPTVLVLPVLPGVSPAPGPAVYQQTGIPGGAIGNGFVLPPPGAAAVRAAFGGRRPRGRWVRAWRTVWSHPWT